jgi:5-methylcytosine-specific restriction protein A
VNNCTNCGAIVKPPKRSWCSDKCVSDWKLEHWPTAWTAAVLERDKGVCAQCGLDTELLAAWVWSYRSESSFQRDPARESLYRQTIRTLKKQGFYEWPRSLWEADHIVPRVEGGNNKLDNLRTLCVPCHKAETRLLRTRLADNRRRQSAIDFAGAPK